MQVWLYQNRIILLSEENDLSFGIYSVMFMVPVSLASLLALDSENEDIS